MIYFCIPAHNEERTVGVVLWKLRQVMAELNRDYQIIVVDDASSDSTPTVLSPYIRVLPLTVIRNSQKRGYSDALEVAIREAVRRSPYPKRDAVIVLQADFTEDPDVVPLLVKRIEAGADLVSTEVDIEAETPRPFRWGRKLFRWMLRGKEWARGDVLSGLRAYRVVTLKRAIDSRSGSRLLSWNGWGANVELLSLTAPHSRRTEVVETSLKHHRHQRDTRFSFMEQMRQVRGAASGEVNASAGTLAADGVVATPLPIAVEPPTARQHPRGRERVRDMKGPEKRTRSDSRAPRAPSDRSERSERPARGGRGGRGGAKPAAGTQQRPAARGQQQEGPRPVVHEGQPELGEAAAPLADGVNAESAPPAKKRRRPRRRKGPRTQQSPQLVVEGQTEAPVEASSEESKTEARGEGEAPKKKSRRGRRGGRGRRRGPKTQSGENNENASGNGGEAPPPLAAEGD